MRRALALAILFHLLLLAALTALMQRGPSGSDPAPSLEVALQHTGSARDGHSADANNSESPRTIPPAPQQPSPDSRALPADTATAAASLAGNAGLPLPGSNTVALPDMPSPLDALKRDYVLALSRHLLAQPFPYPADARRRGVEGTVIVTFSLDAGGNITAARVTASSGDAVLDAAALAAVRERSPLPRPPAGLPVGELEWDWPVPFRLD